MSTKQERFQRIDAAVFRTITDADWAVALREARRCRNVVRDQIREKILNLALGKPEVATIGATKSGGVGKLNTG